MKVEIETTDLVGTSQADQHTKSWTFRKTRVNKHKNRDSRWGPGKVHWLIYIPKASSENHNGFGYYVRACLRFSEAENALGGVMGDIGNVTKDTPVTCKICQRWEANG